MRDSDFGCAITHYNALSDGALKQQKLCLVYLAKGGVTLTALINTINKNDSKLLGNLANRLTPWSSTKSADLDLAKTHCANFAAESSSGDQGTLLKSISLFSHCAIRIAKTDQFVAISSSDTACTTSGNNVGGITAADIGPSSGDISSTSVGMCPADVTTCVSDIAGISGTGLTNAGLGDIKSSLDAIPANLKDTSAATSAQRIAIRSTI